MGSVTTLVTGDGGRCDVGDAGPLVISGLALAAEGILVATGSLDLVSFNGAVTVIVPDAVVLSQRVGVGRDGQVFVSTADVQTGCSQVYRVLGSNAVLFVGSTIFCGCVDTDQAGDGGVTFANVQGLVGDDGGTLYASEWSTPFGACGGIRKIEPSGRTTTLAGDGAASFRNGPGAQAEFLMTSGLAVDALGNLYVADTGNEMIRKIAPDGTTSTLAGTLDAGFEDGKGGLEGTATFNDPHDVAVDALGTIYVADLGNNAVRMIASDGTTTTLVGNGTFGSVNGTLGRNGTTELSHPSTIAVDPAGKNVYVGESVVNADNTSTCGSIRVIHIGN